MSAPGDRRSAKGTGLMAPVPSPARPADTASNTSLDHHHHHHQLPKRVDSRGGGPPPTMAANREGAPSPAVRGGGGGGGRAAEMVPRLNLSNLNDRDSETQSTEGDQNNTVAPGGGAHHQPPSHLAHAQHGQQHPLPHPHHHVHAHHQHQHQHQQHAKHVVGAGLPSPQHAQYHGGNPPPGQGQPPQQQGQQQGIAGADRRSSGISPSTAPHHQHQHQHHNQQQLSRMSYPNYGGANPSSGGQQGVNQSSADSPSRLSRSNMGTGSHSQLHPGVAVAGGTAQHRTPSPASIDLNQPVNPEKLGWKDRMKRFYEVYNPEKVDKVEELLKTYPNDEAGVWKAMVKKYGAEKPLTMGEYLKRTGQPIPMVQHANRPGTPQPNQGGRAPTPQRTGSAHGPPTAAVPAQQDTSVLSASGRSDAGAAQQQRHQHHHQHQHHSAGAAAFHQHHQAQQSGTAPAQPPQGAKGAPPPQGHPQHHLVHHHHQHQQHAQHQRIHPQQQQQTTGKEEDKAQEEDPSKKLEASRRDSQRPKEETPPAESVKRQEEDEEKKALEATGKEPTSSTYSGQPPSSDLAATRKPSSSALQQQRHETTATADGTKRTGEEVRKASFKKEEDRGVDHGGDDSRTEKEGGRPKRFLPKEMVCSDSSDDDSTPGGGKPRGYQAKQEEKRGTTTTTIPAVSASSSLQKQELARTGSSSGLLSDNKRVTTLPSQRTQEEEEHYQQQQQQQQPYESPSLRKVPSGRGLAGPARPSTTSTALPTSLPGPTTTTAAGGGGPGRAEAQFENQSFGRSVRSEGVASTEFADSYRGGNEQRQQQQQQQQRHQPRNRIPQTDSATNEEVQEKDSRQRSRRQEPQEPVSPPRLVNPPWNGPLSTKRRSSSAAKRLGTNAGTAEDIEREERRKKMKEIYGRYHPMPESQVNVSDRGKISQEEEREFPDGNLDEYREYCKQRAKETQALLAERARRDLEQIKRQREEQAAIEKEREEAQRRRDEEIRRMRRARNSTTDDSETWLLTPPRRDDGTSPSEHESSPEREAAGKRKHPSPVGGKNRRLPRNNNNNRNSRMAPSPPKSDTSSQQKSRGKGAAGGEGGVGARSDDDDSFLKKADISFSAIESNKDQSTVSLEVPPPDSTKRKGGSGTEAGVRRSSANSNTRTSSPGTRTAASGALASNKTNTGERRHIASPSVRKQYSNNDADEPKNNRFVSPQPTKPRGRSREALARGAGAQQQRHTAAARKVRDQEHDEDEDDEEENNRRSPTGIEQKPGYRTVTGFFGYGDDISCGRSFAGSRQRYVSPARRSVTAARDGSVGGGETNTSGAGVGGRHRISSPSPRGHGIEVIDRRQFTPNIEKPPMPEEIFGVQKTRIKCSVRIGPPHGGRTPSPPRGGSSSQNRSHTLSPDGHHRGGRSTSHSPDRNRPRHVVHCNTETPYEVFSTFHQPARIRNQPSAWARTERPPTIFEDVEGKSRVVKIIRDVPKGPEAVQRQEEVARRLARPKPLFVSAGHPVAED